MQLFCTFLYIINNANAQPLFEPNELSSISYITKNEISLELQDIIDSLTKANGYNNNIKLAQIKINAHEPIIIYTKNRHFPFYGVIAITENNKHSVHLSNQSFLNIRYIDVPKENKNLLFFEPETHLQANFIVTNFSNLKSENSIYILLDFLYLGILFSLFTIGFIFYFIDVIKIQLLFSVWILSLFISMAFTTNIIDVVIKLQPDIYRNLELILYPIVNLTLLLLIKHLINNVALRIKQLFTVLIILNIIPILLLIFNHSVFYFKFIPVLTLTTFIFSLTQVLIGYKNDTTLKYFLIGFVLMLTSMLFYIVFRNNSFMHDYNKLVFQICSTTQCILYYLGIQIKKNKYTENLFKSNILNLQSLISIREKISRDLHDDIGSSLSSISIYTEAIHQNLIQGNTEKALQLVNIIGRNSRNAIMQLSEITWMANPKFDKLSNLFEKLEIFGNDILGSKNIRFICQELTKNESIKNISLSINERKNIYLIFKELINNIAKHSNASEVKLTFNLYQNKLNISIEENGSGYNFNENKSGNGLNNIVVRAKEINATCDFKSYDTNKHVFSITKIFS